MSDYECPRGEFPDAEEVVIAICEQFASAGTYLPDDPEQVEAMLPVVLVLRNGGPNDGITDFPIIELGVIGRTRAESQRILRQCSEAIRRSQGTAPCGALIDHVREVTGTTQMPAADPKNRLVEASFALAFRRRR